MKQLVIFDLDGTLLNTIHDLATATNFALTRLGYPEHPLSAYPFMVGNGVAKLLQRALPSGERTDERLKQMREGFYEYYGEHMADDTVPYHGIPALLQQLTDNGVKVAVASNKYQAAVEKLIHHFFPDIPWVAVEGNKEGVPTKPDPSVVFEILGKAQTPKAQVLYVGDSGIDMETARRACVTSVGVTWGFRPRAELEAGYADFIIDTPEQLLPLALE